MTITSPEAVNFANFLQDQGVEIEYQECPMGGWTCVLGKNTRNGNECSIRFDFHPLLVTMDPDLYGRKVDETIMLVAERLMDGREV